MIKIEKLNKFYNRHKKNEIHVINNTSLELPDKGLVSLLGESGCGKTTLLNVIGGLDKANGGAVYYNDEKVTGRSSHKIDKLRGLNIGYVFQDYRLLDNLSVYDNIALVLKMVGIKDKEEIKKRVTFVLNAVNMYRFRNRLASNLSGGERQRVGIARALVKNPPIIIADEPTGNLDSRNTIEIMNIIKSISINKLVILVTHERNLAEFYASRIIELKDGKVVRDYNNVHENSLDYRVDNKLYLKDLDNHNTFNNEITNIEYFSDEEKATKITLVVQNGNLYIKGEGLKKVEVVDDTSAIEFVDDHYKPLEKSDYENYAYDTSEFKGTMKYSSIFKPFAFLIEGFKKVGSFSIIKKLLLVGFCFAAMATLLSFSRIFGVLNITDDEFTTVNKNYLLVKMPEVSLESYQALTQLDSVDYVVTSNSLLTMNLKLDFFYQTIDLTVGLEGSMAAVESLDPTSIIYGSMAQEGEKQIVIDQMIAKKIIDDGQVVQAGVKKVEDFVNLPIKIDKLGTYTICGISNTQAPSIYVPKNDFTNITLYSPYQPMDGGIMYNVEVKDTNVTVSAVQTRDYQLYLNDNSIKLKKGRYPKKDYEVIINYDLKDTYKLNKKIPYKVNGVKLKVVGYYTSTRGVSEYLVSNQTLMYDLITNTSDLSIYTNNKEQTMAEVQALGYNVTDPYQTDRKSYITSKQEGINTSLIVGAVMIFISLIEIYLMLRSSFLSRIKEVGIYRAIGVKKLDIYRMFLGEILAITTYTSVIGFSFMYYTISVLQTIVYIGDDYILNTQVVLISVLVFYLFNILVGLIPVYRTLRKAPALIMSRTDVD